MTYYAICNVGGPISIRLDAEVLDDARTEFSSIDHRECIDDASTDVEDDFGLDGYGLDESEFDDLLIDAGLAPVDTLNPIHNCHAGTTSHLADGWYLWAAA